MSDAKFAAVYTKRLKKLISFIKENHKLSFTKNNNPVLFLWIGK